MPGKNLRLGERGFAAVAAAILAAVEGGILPPGMTTLDQELEAIPKRQYAGQDARLWSLDIPGLGAWAHTVAGSRRAAPKARFIPAQPGGLGTRTTGAKALKARLMGLTIQEWVNGLLRGYESTFPR